MTLAEMERKQVLACDILNMYQYPMGNIPPTLKDSDYDEACIPMHGGFRRTLIYPWLWRRDGFTWVGDHYYRGYYNYWNMFWWFYW
jgi:hypothetical protein